jgi:PAS domain S-box-containing protein
LEGPLVGRCQRLEIAFHLVVVRLKTFQLPPWLLRYGVAVLVVILAVGAVSIPELGRSLVIVVFLAVLLSAWYGGLGPGLLTTGIITALAVHRLVFIEPHFVMWRAIWVVLFVGSGVLLSFLIEARHQARRTLALSQQWLTGVLTSIGDAVITTDDRGRVTFLNPVAEQLTGWTSAEAVGRDLLEVFHVVSADTRLPLTSPVERVLGQKRIVGLAKHTVLIAKDGTERPVDDSGAPIKDKTGEITGVVLVFRDVTLRQQAEAIQARLASIVESSNDGIISESLDGTVTSWNTGAERLFGYQDGEMIGHPITRLVPQDKLEEESEFQSRLGRGETVEPFESIRLTKDGRSIDVSIRMSPIRDGSGTVIGTSNIARDITDRKRLEQELKQRVDELADGHRRKDEFLAMLAHELRNPLAAINNAVQVNHLTGVPEPIAWSMGIISRQTKHLTRMIDDLLDVSRITRGKIKLQKERVDVANVMYSAVGSARPLVESRHHELTVAVPDDELAADADPIRLEQIVANLLMNAAKYSDQGGKIALSAERDGNWIVIKVRDTGMGMPIDQIGKMFDLFTQGDRSLARSEGGLGIGLTVARSLAEMHGGRLTANSEGPGTGSEFVVYLPAAMPEKIAKSQQFTMPQAARRRGGSRVMIIEDNIDLASGMAGLLKLWNHEVWVAYDGPSGLEAVRAHRPEVVLLDLGLPGMDGYEVANHLRREEFGKDVLLIAVTGYGKEEDRQQAFSAGFDHFVTKPVDYPTLLALMVGPEPAAS